MKNPALFQSSIPLQEKLLFTKHLSIMLKSGVPISEAIEILIEQSKSPAFRHALDTTNRSLKNGATLSDSLKKGTKAFDQFYLSIIAVGEESGTLEKSLEYLSIQLEKEYYLRKKVQGALLYPGIVLSAIFIVGGFIAVFILPQLIGFFQAFNTELPVATKILLWIAQYFKSYGLITLGAVGGLFVGGIFAVRTKAIQPLWHRFVYSIPVTGPLLHATQLVRFNRNLGILLQSGVPITTSLDTTRKTLTNIHYIRALDSVLANTKKGKSISDSLKANPHQAFPAITVKMIAIGEKTGKLDETLIYLSEFYESEIDSNTKNLSTVLEPILLIVIGLVVAFIALAIISPIYELTGSIRK